ncbi:MAG: tetratricopeptide repeat protein [Gallionellaceae bacterium]
MYQVKSNNDSWAMCQDILEEIMIRGRRLRVCLVVLMCWISAAAGETAGADQKKPLTIDQMHKMGSAELLRRTDATAEEDYQAGLIAFDKQELVEAQGLFERAAKKGHTGAMVKYADLLNRAGFIDEAVASYRKAAEQGNPEAQFDMAMMYLDLGNYDWKDMNSKIHPIEARTWMLRAAEQGYPDAIKVVATAYADGGLGLTAADRTDAEVLRWLSIAEDIGDGMAMDKLAEAYREGKYGLPVDKELSDMWAANARKAYGLKEEEQKKRKKRRL